MSSREEKPFPKPASIAQPMSRNRDSGVTGRGSRMPGQIVRVARSSSASRGENSFQRPPERPISRESAPSAGYAAGRQHPSQAGAPRAAQMRRGPPPASPEHPQPSGSSRPAEGVPTPTKGRGRGRGKGKGKGMAQAQVFVRWRPLVGDELKRGDALVGYTCTEDAEDQSLSSVSVSSDRIRSKSWKGGRFAGVFQDGENNAHVFEHAVTPMLSTVLAGKSACCFCYGHTGSGKTHTVLGYGPELGLYRLGAERIFESFAAVADQPPGGFQLSVRFAELHCDRAFDLFESRAECKVREDANGEVHFRKDPIVHPDGRVTVRPLSVIRCGSAEDVAAAVALGSKLRVVGSSSLHDQSSRSHAILEMEIVTDELIAAREALIQEESMLVPLGKALEEMNFNAAQGEDVDPGHKEDAQARVMAQAEVLEEAKEHLAQVMSGGHPCQGGTLVLIDLAGSEHGADADGSGRKQTKQEITEAKGINQSLLFLKEVVRALASGNGHVPYRSCRLTRVMRHWLRHGCCCAMVANVSTSDLQVAKSLSTLQYAALVASAGA